MKRPTINPTLRRLFITAGNRKISKRRLHAPAFGPRNSLNPRLVHAKETNLMEIAGRRGNLRGRATIQKRPRNSWDLFRERWHVQARGPSRMRYIKRTRAFYSSIRRGARHDTFFSRARKLFSVRCSIGGLHRAVMSLYTCCE